jgi:hypothetical protein
MDTLFDVIYREIELGHIICTLREMGGVAPLRNKTSGAVIGA